MPQSSIRSQKCDQSKGRNIPEKIKSLVKRSPGLRRWEIAQQIQTTLTVVNMTIDSFIESGRCDETDDRVYLLSDTERVARIVEGQPGIMISVIAARVGIAPAIVDRLINGDAYDRSGDRVFPKGAIPSTVKIYTDASVKAPINTDPQGRLSGDAPIERMGGVPRTSEAIKRQQKTAAETRHKRDLAEIANLNIQRTGLINELKRKNLQLNELKRRVADRRSALLEEV